jgi:hypothetical protein
MAAAMAMEGATAMETRSSAAVEALAKAVAAAHESRY